MRPNIGDGPFIHTMGMVEKEAMGKVGRPTMVVVTMSVILNAGVS